jgi:WD40 repeat protein
MKGSFNDVVHTEKFSHSKHISLIEWIKKDDGTLYLATAALDNTLKVWDFENETELCTVSHKCGFKSIKYSKEMDILGFLDVEGKIGFLNTSANPTPAA